MEPNTEATPLQPPMSTRHAPYERGDTLVEVIIDCRPANFACHGGNLLTAGLNRVRVLTSDLAAIMLQCDDDSDRAAWAAAELEYDREKKRYVTDGLKDIELASYDSVEDREADMRDKKRELLASFALSPSACFARAAEYETPPRQSKPYRSVTPVVRDIPIPQDVERLAAEQKALADKADADARLALLVGASVAQALGAAGVVPPSAAKSKG